eukprot:TRINITY_DN28797_c0_g1_i1.p4 TRINITY_DN28797_c0_g1~~TRINITY_DN28797_c0_g1_i1.p4  ORF type:complete len:102 (+),score=19.78 TRINITY_DN28797_c0_g1_i1:52-357(+)
MATVIAGIAAYAAILNLPYMRQQMKGQLRGTYDEVSAAVAENLQQSLDQKLQDSDSQVRGYIQPVQQLIAQRIQNIEQGQVRLKEFEERLSGLQKEANNVE